MKLKKGWEGEGGAHVLGRGEALNIIKIRCIYEILKELIKALC